MLGPRVRLSLVSAIRPSVRIRVRVAGLHSTVIPNSQSITNEFKHFLETNNDQAAFGLLGQDIHHQVLEFFVVRNIRLLPQVLAAHPKFVLSNELWSNYVSHTCEALNIEGAKLIYHTLIDNDEIPHPPFLINPESLQHLCLIFQRHLCPGYIRGLQVYFKRFYSIYGHRSCYKTLLISQVETYSELGDIKKALHCFKYLCILFREHYNNQTKSEYLEKIYSMMNDSHHRRLANMKSNEITMHLDEETMSETDLLQKQLLEDVGGTLYSPLTDKSVTSRLVPCLDGYIQINDLPNFHSLVTRVVDAHFKSDSGSKIQNLMKLISSYHFMLSTFVVSGLCTNLHLPEAVAIMKKTQSKNLDYILPAIYKHDLFVHILRSCKKKLATEDITDLIEEIMNFYIKVYSNSTYSGKVMENYLVLILDHPRFQSKLITQYLNPFIKLSNDKIYLEPVDYGKLDQIFGIRNSEFSEIVKIVSD